MMQPGTDFAGVDVECSSKSGGDAEIKPSGMNARKAEAIFGLDIVTVPIGPMMQLGTDSTGSDLFSESASTIDDGFESIASVIGLANEVVPVAAHICCNCNGMRLTT